MKVAVDSGALVGGHGARGIGVHTRELLSALDEIVNKRKDITIEAFNFSKNRHRLSNHNYDMVHYSAFHPNFIDLPFKKPAPKVVLTIHDLIPLIYPGHYPPGIKGELKFIANKFLIKKNVDAIITISETSKKDICRFLGVNPDMVHVIYLAPRKVFKRTADSEKQKIKEKYCLPKKFALYVGDINYNKNIPNLIKACKIAGIPLVICGKQALGVDNKGIDLMSLEGPRDWIRFLFGKPHPELAHYRELIKEFDKGKGVIRLGYVPDEDLVSIYNLASAYVQSSLYEGFGLPVLEALACGCPVICSKTQTLVEIAKGAARFVDPNNPEDIAGGFSNLIKDPKLPRDYSWEKTAKETLQVYMRV